MNLDVIILVFLILDIVADIALVDTYQKRNTVITAQNEILKDILAEKYEIEKEEVTHEQNQT